MHKGNSDNLYKKIISFCDKRKKINIMTLNYTNDITIFY